MTPASRRSVQTSMIVAIAACACVGADLVHEGAGHGVASWLTGNRILTISTVALQNAEPSRLVSAAGTVANVVAGVAALLLLRRVRRLTATAWFVWLFAAFNLFNTGYLVSSAVIQSGDWAAVIRGLTPPAAWRIGMAAAGAALYWLSVRAIARAMGRFIEQRENSVSDLRRLVAPAYVTAGLIFTAAALFNPISPALILGSGVAASFGLNAGLLAVPAVLSDKSHLATRTNALSMNAVWLTFGLLAAALFIGVLGPGIHFN